MATNGKFQPVLNPLVSAMLTDLYQISMAYAYWKAGRQDEKVVFDLFFRKCPFQGEFTVFAGLNGVMSLLNSFRFGPGDIEYLRKVVPNCDEEFFVWLGQLSCRDIRVYALEEGMLCFPRVPMLVVEGPLAVAQLLETPLLNLINYPSLVATNAARLRVAAGPDKTMLEFGCRRAQGPDGALSASHYSYIGGFDATSNVLAGKLIGIDVKGTHAHSFVQSYTSFDQITDPMLDGKDFVTMVLGYRERLDPNGTSKLSELAAFTAFAQAFPDGFLGLLDTYDTLQSGVPNFLCVALALDDLGHRALGCRIDSGDLGYFSLEVRRMVTEASESFGRPFLKQTNIVASNDINEESLHSLADQGHAINTFGVGTNLVTCESQPALGCVYKLVSIEGMPRMKLSQMTLECQISLDMDEENRKTTLKITIPGRKLAYRLVGSDGVPILDIMLLDGEDPPRPGAPILARHPFEPTKRARVTPSKILPLQQLVWDGQAGGPALKTPAIDEVRSIVSKGLAEIRQDVLHRLNPTPYKVSVSERLYDFLHNLWEKEAPIRELR